MILNIRVHITQSGTACTSNIGLCTYIGMLFSGTEPLNEGHYGADDFVPCKRSSGVPY